MRRVAALEASWEAIREEALALEASAFEPMPYAEGYTGDWSVFLLFGGRWDGDFPGAKPERNRARCPHTMEVVRGVEGLRLAGFARLAPGGAILPHCDPRQDDEIRAILALQLPPGEDWWREGQARLLDTRRSHFARNPSDRPRLTLVVDMIWPGPWPTEPWWQGPE